MKDVISVIIPVYNREDYVEECLNSVLTQSYQSFEIIIIDDGSTDKTFEICESLAKTEPRIKLVKGEHAGVSAARNKALDMSSGEYVFFIDSDDIIHPTLLESLLQSLKNTDAAIGGTNVMSISHANWDKLKSYIKEKDTAPCETEYKTNIEAINKMLSGGTPINLIGGVMMSRDLIGETRFRTDLFIAEDFYFVYENLIKGANVIYLKPNRYFARNHDKNSSWNYDFEGFYSRFRRRELVWKSELEFGRTENAKRQAAAGFATYSMCAKRHKFADDQIKKMCNHLKQFRKDIIPALQLKSKVCFILYVYFPFTYFWVRKFFKK